MPALTLHTQNVRLAPRAVISCPPTPVKSKQGAEKERCAPATRHQQWHGSGVVNLVVTLAAPGQLVIPMTPTDTPSTRLATVSHGRNSEREDKGLVKTCCCGQPGHCFRLGVKPWHLEHQRVPRKERPRQVTSS